MEPYSLAVLLKEFSVFTEHMALYLPRTSDMKQLGKVVKYDQTATVMHYTMEGASKALCFYTGGFHLQ